MTVTVGEMKHRLLIETQQLTRDDYGGDTTVWATLGSCWAAATNTGAARDRWQKGEIEHTEDVRFVIRYNQSFTLDERLASKYRVTHRGRVYRVSTIVPSQLDLKYLELSCVAWGATEEHDT